MSEAIRQHGKTKVEQLLERIRRQQQTLDEYAVANTRMLEECRILKHRIRSHKGAFTKLKNGITPKQKPDTNQVEMPV